MMFIHEDENPFPQISKQRPRKRLLQRAARLAPPTWPLPSRTQYNTFNTEDSTLPTRIQYNTIQKKRQYVRSLSLPRLSYLVISVWTVKCKHLPILLRVLLDRCQNSGRARNQMLVCVFMHWCWVHATAGVWKIQEKNGKKQSLDVEYCISLSCWSIKGKMTLAHNGKRRPADGFLWKMHSLESQQKPQEEVCYGAVAFPWRAGMSCFS